jgi:hypothetical protein
MLGAKTIMMAASLILFSAEQSFGQSSYYDATMEPLTSFALAPRRTLPKPTRQVFEGQAKRRSFFWTDAPQSFQSNFEKR